MSIRRDVQVIFERDPAARSVVEVLVAYPGLHALWFFRASHWLWVRGWRLAGRLLSHLGRFATGIEIHPGATIGEGFFIDHGMGVVIGETAEIGDNVTLYHGVTLGGVSWRKEKRHPTIGDHVVIGAGAKVLGPITVGAHSRVGANSVVVKDVPPNSVVVGVPGRVRSRAGDLAEGVGHEDLSHDRLHDTTLELLEQLQLRLAAVESEIAQSDEQFAFERRIAAGNAIGYDGPWGI